ncbi:MAG: tRNA 2-thiouridine(34) synthase MnmA [Spirochaetes bacterium]|nr:tRNA 2-thiouridine(34) synthase MnmA [Spirochaetota bacterium]
MQKQKVMMAMSGGVDSSVAAYLLIEAGYEVAGITMCIGVKAQCGEAKTCCGPADIEDAKEVCRVLGIQHYVLDFSDEMEELVIKPFIDEYKIGRTPNPCIRCNELLKFGLLLDKALAMGFDLLATGHYAKLELKNGIYFLAESADKWKDQTYFLYSVPQAKLKHVIFPLDGYTKAEVRKIAADKDIPVFQKPDSQDVCFYPSGGSAEFFNSRKIKSRPGEIVHVDGRILGKHNGIIFYTIGQRRGLGISNPDPLYVVLIDPSANRVIVGEKKYLQASGLTAEIKNLNYTAKEGTASAKIRYTTRQSPCRYSVNDNKLHIIFDDPQEAITPGQSVVLYKDSLVIGGGTIKRVLDLKSFDIS